MEVKHGLSQGRLNRASDFAKGFLESVSKIDLMYQLSTQNHIDEDLAENYIKNNIKELERNLEYFKSYIKQRDDMR